MVINIIEYGYVSGDMFFGRDDGINKFGISGSIGGAFKYNFELFFNICGSRQAFSFHISVKNDFKNEVFAFSCFNEFFVICPKVLFPFRVAEIFYIDFKIFS